LRWLARLLQRMLVFGLGVFTVWLIVFVVFPVADNRLNWTVAVGVTYGLAAYVILPRVIRLGLKILQRGKVPSFCMTGDGLPGDPVNITLIGDMQQLCAAFKTAGWSEADPLSLSSSWGMVQAFVFNSPYPTAPFSTLYLFGRGQDIGFQKAIDDSPRKRHHVRFWASRLERGEHELATPDFWLNTDRPPAQAQALWVGAATKDTGISLTKLSFQITHATDSDTNAERDFIVSELREYGVIGEVTLHRAGQHLNAKRVNHYITDGEVAAAALN
jgi:hypothetical protein